MRAINEVYRHFIGITTHAFISQRNLCETLTFSISTDSICCGFVVQLEGRRVCCRHISTRISCPVTPAWMHHSLVLFVANDANCTHAWLQ